MKGNSIFAGRQQSWTVWGGQGNEVTEEQGLNRNWCCCLPYGAPFLRSVSNLAQSECVYLMWVLVLNYNHLLPSKSYANKPQTLMRAVKWKGKGRGAPPLAIVMEPQLRLSFICRAALACIATKKECCLYKPWHMKGQQAESRLQKLRNTAFPNGFS